MLVTRARVKLGDDVLGDDPTVHRLQARVADLLDKEAALFVPSGTMGNQLAILGHCRPGDEVVVGEGSHSVWYESGAGAAIGGAMGGGTADRMGMGCDHPGVRASSRSCILAGAMDSPWSVVNSRMGPPHPGVRQFRVPWQRCLGHGPICSNPL